MAEVFSGVIAGGFAVTSLALQLLETAQKLHTFWHSCSQANPKIQRIRDHVATLQAISISIIEICETKGNIRCRQSVVQSLEICNREAKKLLEMVPKQDDCINRHPLRLKAISVKTALREKTIDKVEAQLQGDLLMLMFALQPFFYCVGRQDFHDINTSMQNFSGGKHYHVNELTTQHHVTKSLNGGAGIIDGPAPSSNAVGSRRREALLQFHDSRMIVKVDSSRTILRWMSNAGLSAPLWFRKLLKSFLFGMVYSAATDDSYFGGGHGFGPIFHTRLKLRSPIMSVQIQSSNFPWSLTSYPVVTCQSEIFGLCADGDIKTVQLWIRKSWASPFVVDQHGENLLHWAARNAQAEMCLYLLRLGVDGAAYDDRLLTPLDHLARKIGPTFAYPARVVDTIRALVERGGCQPILPITSNTVGFYRGPEEGFAWLFKSEYGGSDLNQKDSEGWTLVGSAALTLGWCTKAGVVDEEACRQSLYLLKAGADPHQKSGRGQLTPLETYLRGCTANAVDHAGRWLQVLAQSGFNLHQYALKEQSLQGSDQFIRMTWDSDLWKWIPTRRRVMFWYGKTTEELMIWVEDYDALSWFGAGKWDLEIFQVCDISSTLERWKNINSCINILEVEAVTTNGVPIVLTEQAHRGLLQRISRTRWIHLLAITLLFNYLFHLYILKLK